jgi:hypothetical protein
LSGPRKTPDISEEHAGRLLASERLLTIPGWFAEVDLVRIGQSTASGTRGTTQQGAANHTAACHGAESGTGTGTNTRATERTITGALAAAGQPEKADRRNRNRQTLEFHKNLLARNRENSLHP